MTTTATPAPKAPAEGKAPVDTLNTREIAEKLGTDARTLRRYLRSANQGVGEGKRYALDPKALPALRKDFGAWVKAQDEARAAKAKPATAKREAKAPAA